MDLDPLPSKIIGVSIRERQTVGLNVWFRLNQKVTPKLTVSLTATLNPSFPNSFQRVQLPPFHINTPVSVSVATATAMYFHITKPVIYGGDFFRVVNSVMVQSIHRLTLIWFGDCYCLWQILNFVNFFYHLFLIYHSRRVEFTGSGEEKKEKHSRLRVCK